MGGSSSKYNQNGGIAIQLENSFCLSGQQVSGTIHISITSPMAPSTLFLHFKGKEETNWSETTTVTVKTRHNHRRRRDITRNFGGKATVCNYQNPIFVFDRQLEIGGYSIPFTFLLPNDIPGTFLCEKYDMKAEVSYKFHAKLISKNDEKLKGRALVNVRQQAVNYVADVNVEKSAKLKTWCYKKQGECKIQASYARDTYTPSQVADISVVVDNSSSLLDVTGISYQFYYTLLLRSSRVATNYSTGTLFTGFIPKRITPGDSLLNKSSVEIKLNFPSKIKPSHTMYSIKGKLIECMYTSRVTAEMDGSCMCCGDSPSLKTIISIVPNLIMAPSAPEAPPDWNPVVLDPISLNYDPAFEITPSAPMAP